MEHRGGWTTYGQPVGVLMLDTRFPRPPGDVGNAATYDFPVRYKTVHGATTDRIMGTEPDADLIKPFAVAARELQDEGVSLITTSCGFLAPFHAELAAAVDVPVLTSSLLQVPLVATTLRPGRTVGVFTERAHNLNDGHFAGVGWDTTKIPVHVQGMPPDAVFPATFIDGRDRLDTDELRAEMVAMTHAFLEACPDAGAIVLECTNMGPFSGAVAAASGLPVFDLNTLVRWAHSALVPAFA